jgi:uncharacterized protein YfiM (DUF2279 family)
MRNYYLLFLLFCFLTIPHLAAAQPRSYPDTLNPARLRTVIVAESAFYVAGLSYLQFVWYRNHERTPFHWYNDNAGWLQLDKAGHAYAAYFESAIGYHALRWAGVSRRKSLWYGGMLGLVLQTPIEVFDGLYEGYGFSWGDMVANAAGSALFMTQQALWDEQRVRMKFSYAPSPYAQYRPWVLGESHGQRFFQDYNGHTYWLSLNLNSVAPAWHLPPWLNVAVGYSGNGMLSEFKNPAFSRGIRMPELDRNRQYFLSVDLDLTQFNPRSRLLRSVFRTLNLVKIPAPALEYNRREGLRLRPLYF